MICRNSIARTILLRHEIVGKVLTMQFAPRQQEDADNRESLVQELAQLEFWLPLQLRRQPVDESLDAPFWSCMLHACIQ